MKFMRLTITLLLVALLGFNSAVLSVGGQQRQNESDGEPEAHHHDERDVVYLPYLNLDQKLQATISLTNAEAKEVELAITAYALNGIMLGVVGAGDRLGSGETRTLNADALPAGTATIKVESSLPIISQAAIQSSDGSKSETMPALRGSDNLLSFPKLADDQSIVLFNPNFGAVSAEAIAFRGDGSEVVRARIGDVAAMGSRIFSSSEIFGQDALSQAAIIRVAADVPMMGAQLAGGREADLVGLPALTTTSRDWSFPIKRNAGDFQLWTKVGAFNPGVETTRLVVTAFDSEGNQLFNGELGSLPGGASSVFNLTEIVPADAALVQISSEQAVSGYEVVGVESGRGMAAAEGSAIGLPTFEFTGASESLSVSIRSDEMQNVGQAGEKKLRMSQTKLQQMVALAQANLSSTIPVSDGFDYPVGSTGYVTQTSTDDDGWFNARDFGSLNHLGEDWNGNVGGDNDCGATVFAASKGVIHQTFTGISGWGRVMIIRHQLPDGTLVETLYGHLQSFEKTSGSVYRRELIGRVGKPAQGECNSDGTNCCHLHLEVRYMNCREWGKYGPGYATDRTGWTDPSNFIDSKRYFYEGFFETPTCDIIKGWAWKPADPNGAINVDIYDGSARILTVPANQFRQDLLNAGKGNGYHAFSVATPASLKDGRVHTLRAKIGGTNIELANNPRTLTCVTLPVAASLYSPTPGATFGSSTVTFRWNSGASISQYHLWIGNTFGGRELYDAGQGTSLSRTIYNLPTDGRRIYVRLWSWTGSSWLSRDYTYTAYRR